MHRIFLFLLLLGVLAPVAFAASPPTFCKCTCFKQSKIIPLGPQHTGTPPSFLARDSSPSSPLLMRSASTSCSQCTKAFCISNLGVDICKDATDDDVQTMCFQRDSNKDRIIVWLFILSTTGLLGWAVVKRLMEMREGKMRGHITPTRVEYSPVQQGR